MMIPLKKTHNTLELKKKSISNDFFKILHWPMRGQNYWDYNWEKVHCHF